MSQHSNLQEALGVLDGRLRSLHALTRANSFLVEILRNEREVLEKMDGDVARDMLRARARRHFGAEAGENACPETLKVLETALSQPCEAAQTESAQIIPFPSRRDA
jgi:hypothetical protein